MLFYTLWVARFQICNLTRSVTVYSQKGTQSFVHCLNKVIHMYNIPYCMNVGLQIHSSTVLCVS